MRAREQTVGVISVDPSSPFTQGALLGDRIRLADHFLDPGVFIRSMGTRGHLGGLAEATLQALLVLDAAGKDVVFLETVGAGQSEVEVHRDRRHGRARADAGLGRLGPGAEGGDHGDSRRDRDQQDAITRAAKTMLNEVRSILALEHGATGSRRSCSPRRCAARASTELWEQIEAHRALPRGGRRLEERRRRNLAGEVFAVASARAKAHLEQAVADDPELRRLLDAVQRRELDPLTAVREIMERCSSLTMTQIERRRSLTSRRRAQRIAGIARR